MCGSWRPPDHEQFTLDVDGAGERIVAFALPKRALRDVRGVKAGSAGDVRLHSCAEGEMAT